MKFPLPNVIGLLSALTGWAQGQVHFSNLAGADPTRAPGQVAAPIYLAEPSSPAIEKHGNTATGIPAGTQTYGGALVAGPDYTAQLWVGPAWCAESQLVPVATASFAAASAGFWLPPEQATQVSQLVAHGELTCQVRVWKNNAGQVTSWSQVLADGTVLRGKSTLFVPRFPLPAGLAVPVNLQGLESFNLHTASADLPPHMVNPPRGSVVNPGQPVVLSVSAGGSDPLTYQWQHQGTNLPGQTGWALVIDAAGAADSGEYRVRVSNAAGVISSAPATLIVRAPPVLVEPPRSRSVPRGGTATFQIAAAGAAPLTYQWWFQGQALSDGEHFAGTHTPGLLIRSVQPDDHGAYAVTVANSWGTVTSASAELSILMIDNPGYPPALWTTRSANGIEVRWDLSNIVLQEADAIEGPWRDLPSPITSILQLPLGQPAKYYRVRLP